LKHRLRVTFLLLTMIMMTFTSMLVSPISASAAVDVKAKSAILVDGDTGKILFEKSADMALPPASMTKMMTEYLVRSRLTSR